MNESKMKVLVTGGNGFLGSHIVRILLEEGYEVRAFILKGTPRDTIAGIACEIYEGNLLIPQDIENALEGCDYLIHTAAITDVWPTKNPFSWKINYELVKNIASIVQKKGIKKYIHVGTANSFGFGSPNEPGNEEKPFNSGKYGLDYITSKKAAQDFLLGEAKKENGLPVIIINPTFMIGENDTKPGPGEMIISIIKQKVPGYSAGGRSFASVKDVARACVNAIDEGRVGECYITGGTNLNYKQFFTLVAEKAGVKPPKVFIPTFLAVIFASLMQLIGKIKKKKPLLSVTMAKMSGDGHYYSSSKAERDLGYVQTGLDKALTEAVEWYKAHGYLN
jgi:dihydroflavonol-4-reductase